MSSLQNNKLGYLSLLGLLGLFGLFTEYTSIMWFFGFFGYSYYFTVVPDELFKVNLGKASTITLFTMLALLSATIITGTVTNNPDLFLWGVPVSFLISNIVFAITHSVYEAREASGAKNEDL